MESKTLIRWLAPAIFGVGLLVGESMGQALGNLFQMMGGTETVGKLAGSLLQSSTKDPRLAGLLGKADMSAITPKLADQMCSMLGGGCKAPLTDQQIAAGASIPEHHIGVGIGTHPSRRKLPHVMHHRKVVHVAGNAVVDADVGAHGERPERDWSSNRLERH